MIFKHKRKKVQLRCYCLEPGIEHLFPPLLAKKAVPNWYKNLPSYQMPEKMPTTKVCPGIRDIHSKGFVVPLWSDFKIWYDNNGTVDVTVPLKTNLMQAEVHNPQQWANKYKDWTHVKILNPWFIDCDQPVPFAMLEPFWFVDNIPQYKIAPGVLEFKYQHALHAQMFLPPTSTNATIELNAGQPFIHMVPLEDVDLELSIEELTQTAYNKVIHKSHFTWDLIYYKTKKILSKRE